MLIINLGHEILERVARILAKSDVAACRALRATCRAGRLAANAAVTTIWVGVGLDRHFARCCTPGRAFTSNEALL